MGGVQTTCTDPFDWPLPTKHLDLHLSPHLLQHHCPATAMRLPSASSREPKIAESSAESELYALATARKAARNMRLLLRESFTSSLTMSLRSDNTACIAMMEESGRMTRYISIYGEAARQEI